MKITVSRLASNELLGLVCGPLTSTADAGRCFLHHLVVVNILQIDLCFLHPRRGCNILLPFWARRFPHTCQEVRTLLEYFVGATALNIIRADQPKSTRRRLGLETVGFIAHARRIIALCLENVDDALLDLDIEFGHPASAIRTLQETVCDRSILPTAISLCGEDD